MDNLLDSVAALEEAKTQRGLEGLVLPTIRAADLIASVPEEPRWLVPGLLAPGWCLMVSSREKTGKGTLISYLLGAIEHGAETVFGDAADQRFTSLIFTEEPIDSIAEKAKYQSMVESAYLFAWELPAEVTKLSAKDNKRWRATVDVLVNTAVDGGHKLLFLDNISRAAGIVEEGGVELTRAVEIAADAAKRAGLTVIVDHHHRKSGGDMRDRSRGGTGTAGSVDVALSMDRGKTQADRKRDLVCVGRIKATNWEKTIELNEDWKDYTLVAETTYDNQSVEHDSAGHARKEKRRLDQLAELNQNYSSTQGEPWATADAIAGVWGATSSSTKRWLADRVPTGLVSEGPMDGNRKTYAAAGWETADTQIMTDKPKF